MDVHHDPYVSCPKRAVKGSRVRTRFQASEGVQVVRYAVQIASVAYAYAQAAALTTHQKTSGY
jgi:hypothetical protein